MLARDYLEAVQQKSPGVGFVTIPGGAVSVDDPSAPDSYYSWALRKWVPAWRQEGDGWLPNIPSPSGEQYAYVEHVGMDPSGAFYNTRIHIVDVRTGQDRTALESGHYSVRGWDSSGLLLYRAVQGGEDSGGFRLDLMTGVVTQFTTRSYWRYAASYVWAGYVDPADPTAPDRPWWDFNTLVRVDPRTGAEEKWLYRPGEYLSVLGGVAPDGVLVRSDTWTGSDVEVGLARVLAVTSSGNALSLWEGKPGAMANDVGFSESMPDGQRTWLLGPGGPGGASLYLLEGGRVEPIGVRVGGIAGTCEADM